MTDQYDMPGAHPLPRRAIDEVERLADQYDQEVKSFPLALQGAFSAVVRSTGGAERIHLKTRVLELAALCVAWSKRL